MMKKWLLVSAVLMTMSGIANATSVNLGYGATEITVAVNRDPSVLTPFSFTDVFNLNVTTSTSFVATVTELEKSISVIDGGVPTNYSVYNIVNPSFNYGLYDSLNNLVSNTSSLLPGQYQFRVSGTADGLLGGQYFVGLSVASVTPVPEPELGLTLGLGLALIGFVSLRKSKSA